MAKVVKRVDLTKDKTSPYVRSFVRKIDRSLNDQVKQINVPAFKVNEKNITTQSFFMNHADFTAILGKNVELLNRMMSHAICSTMADDIYEAFLKTRGQVGVWDNHTIYNILASAITFMWNSDTNELYLTGLQFISMNSEELKAYPEDSYMAFSDYNPNRFVQMCLSIRNVALDAIKGIMEKGIPNIFAHGVDSNVALKLFEVKRTFMSNDMQVMWKTLQEKGVEDLTITPATESLIRVFTDNFEKPFIAMMYSNLLNGGLSENVVNLTMGTVRLHIMFDDPVGKNLYDVGIVVRLVTKIGDKSETVEYSTTIGEEFDSVILTTEQLSKTKQEAFGKKLRKFYLDLCAFSVNTYMHVIRTNKKSVEEKSAQPVDIDEKELEDLLNGEDVTSEE